MAEPLGLLQRHGDAMIQNQKEVSVFKITSAEQKRMFWAAIMVAGLGATYLILELLTHWPQRC
jgi:hypothetical protein